MDHAKWPQRKVREEKTGPMIEGFSLVEMAIVLIVMSILTGATLKGYSLIEKARLRTVPLQVEEIRHAVASFQETFQGLPGDFSLATLQFNSAFNGNGNGLIEGEATDLNTEAGAFWVHLKESGLFGSSLPEKIPPVLGAGTGLPTAKTGGCYSVTGSLEKEIGPWIILSVPNASHHKGTLTPAQAQDLDRMMDDGLPHSGLVRAKDDTQGETQGGKCISESLYVTSNKGKNCVLCS